MPGEKYLLAFHDRGRFVTVKALDEMKALMARPGSIYAALETVRGMDYADIEPRYRNVKAPVLVIRGEKDRVTPLRDGKRIAGLFNDELVVVPSFGHVPSWERPEELTRAIEAFFARIEEAP